MKDLYELEDYIEKTDDAELGMMVEIVKKYGNEIPQIIKKIKDKHVENNERDKAEIIFSTVHRSKGLEYDIVQLVDDFITEEKIKKLKEEKKEFDLGKVNEEINLLYVAITRAKNMVYIPESLVPFEFLPSSHIRLTRVQLKERKAEVINLKHQIIPKAIVKNAFTKKDKAYSVDEIRKKHKDAYNPWTTELDDELTIMYCEGASIKDMAMHFGRTTGAIRSRIKKLELKDLYR